MKQSVYVVISGEVQGVWFRASTKKKADELGITGWVRNTPDGKVDAVFEGDESQVNRMIKWCHQGPPLSKVEKVEAKIQDPIKGFNSFKIRY
jgi:acylphosphatase